MKFQIDLRIHIETDPSGEHVLLAEPTVHIVNIKSKGAVDLLGEVAAKPQGRTGIDKDVTYLIEYFASHSARPSLYVPHWPRDKKLIKPYLLAKGHDRIQEMLDGFVRRNDWDWDSEDDKFNAQFVRSAPMSIPGFVMVFDRLDGLLTWDTTEGAYSAAQ